LFEDAKNICEKYLIYPILEWRNKFIDLANQLAEFHGEFDLTDKTAQGGDNRMEQNQQAANEIEYFEVELVDRKDKVLILTELKKPKLNNIQLAKELKITSKNIDHIVISYYIVDLEIMFSRQPFMEDEAKDFSFVKSNHSETKVITKTSDFTSYYFEIPKNFQENNLFIQLTSGAKTKNLTYFPTSMNIFLIQDFGQVKVTDSYSNPLNKVYVKCFKKTGTGKISFHKDGYTDLRGTFDYASLNTEEELKDVKMFSLLIMESGNGAVIKEAKPPKGIGEKKVEARKLRSMGMQEFQKTKAKKMPLNKYQMF